MCILIYLYLSFKNIHPNSFFIPKNNFSLEQTKTRFMADVISSVQIQLNLEFSSIRVAQSYNNFCHITEFKLNQSNSVWDFSL